MKTRQRGQESDEMTSHDEYLTADEVLVSLPFRGSSQTQQPMRKARAVSSSPDYAVQVEATHSFTELPPRADVVPNRNNHIRGNSTLRKARKSSSSPDWMKKATPVEQLEAITVQRARKRDQMAARSTKKFIEEDYDSSEMQSVDPTKRTYRRRE